MFFYIFWNWNLAKELAIDCKRSITETNETGAAKGAEELNALVKQIEMVIQSPSENKSRAIYYLANSGQVQEVRGGGRDYSDRSSYCSYDQSEEEDGGGGDDDDDVDNVKLTRSSSYSIESIERLLAKALLLLHLPWDEDEEESTCHLSSTNIYIVYLSEILMDKCLASGDKYERAYELASKYLLNSYK